MRKVEYIVVATGKAGKLVWIAHACRRVRALAGLDWHKRLHHQQCEMPTHMYATMPSSPQVKRIADAFRPWGVQLSMAVDLTTPKVLGDLDTFDPLDPRVAVWWKNKADTIYG